MLQETKPNLAETGPAGRRILVVDGDDDARDALSRELALHIAAAVEGAGSGVAALALTERWRFDVVLIEVGLADMDGRELCRLLRERHFTAPIILLGTAASEADAIVGLDAGANDFVTRPYHLGLLLARLRAHLRQFEGSEDAVLEIAHYHLHCGRRWLSEAGSDRKIALTAKETALLKYLYRNRARPVDLASIMRDVWGYRADAATHTAQTHIYRLRRKIESDTAHPRILVRVAGGYQLSGPGCWRDARRE